VTFPAGGDSNQFRSRSDTSVATVEPHEHAVVAAIRELSLEWHIIFNKGSVMTLPVDVTKATGLAAALGELWRYTQERRV
jgi:hypothetical protein